MTYLLNLIVIVAVAFMYSNGAMACDGGHKDHPKCQSWAKITAKDMLNHADPAKICEDYAKAVDGCEDPRAFKDHGDERALDIISQKLLDEIKKKRSPYKDENSPELIFNLLMNCEFSSICFPPDQCPEFLKKIEELVKDNRCEEAAKVLDEYMIAKDCGYAIVMKAKAFVEKCGALVCTEEATRLVQDSMLKIEPMATDFIKFQARDAVATYDAATMNEGDLAAIEKARASINVETEFYAKALEPTIKIVDAVVAEAKACEEFAKYEDPNLVVAVDEAKLKIEIAQARTTVWKNADLAKEVVALGDQAKAPIIGVGFTYAVEPEPEK